MTETGRWHDALMAARLCAVDPDGLHGVVVRARAGPVRDRWLAFAASIRPKGAPMIRMPSTIEDERLIGGLDLAATLAAGRPVAMRGVLADADGGMLVAPMAERLSTTTAAQIAAALDGREVRLERDGLTQILPARFMLILLDEGAEPDERAPAALIERLAFHIDLEEVALRESEIAEQFLPGTERGVGLPPAIQDRAGGTIDPALGTVEDGEGAGAGLDASDVAPAPPPCCAWSPSPFRGGIISEPTLETLCGVAIALGIDSMRPPILALRAAIAAARLEGRTAPDADDIALAARLVLAPRATRFPTDQQEPPPDAEPDDPPESEPEDQGDGDSQGLTDMVLDAVRAALPPGLLAEMQQNDGRRTPAKGGRGAGALRQSASNGRRAGVRNGAPRGARIDLIETLKAAAPWQALRRREMAAPRSGLLVRRDDFRARRFVRRAESTTIFAVDASGSAALARLAEVKGAVELLLAEAYVRRAQVALIAFRGAQAEILLPPTRSLARAKRSLADLAGGGGTPLGMGIDAALELAEAARGRGRTPLIVLMTDGRANVARDGGEPQAEALAAARRLGASGIATVFIDSARRPRPDSAALAATMRARYAPLPRFDAEAVRDAVRDADRGR